MIDDGQIDDVEIGLSRYEEIVEAVSGCNEEFVGPSVESVKCSERSQEAVLIRSALKLLM